MKWIAVVALAVTILSAQNAPKPDLLKLTDGLQAAIESRDWKKAAQLSDSLKAAVRDARNQTMAAEGTSLVDAILGWLPRDTETLVVAQQPFVIPESKPDEIQSALVMAQSYVLGLLAAAEGEKLEKALPGQTMRIAALAARNFAEQPADPRGFIPLGMIAYQGCGVYAFAQPVPESILSRSSDESVLGQRVWTSKGSQNDRKDSDTYFVSFPKPDMVLVCNDRSFLTEMISRMDAKANPRALPASLPEWQHLDRSAPLWAIRHFRPDRVSLDPSHPAHLFSGGKDPGAIGVVVHFGLASSAAKAMMLAKLDPWHGVEGATEFQGAAESKKGAEGLWEFSVATKPEAAMMAAFVLMGVLGFAVYL
jgi:hypothetical protein